LTREERIARIAELERWVEETNREWQDEPFPQEVQDAWAENNRELSEHQHVVKELEERDKRLRQLAVNAESREAGSDPGPRPHLPHTQMISRMSEREVYDLSQLRANVLDPETGNRELRDRAMRAVELAHFAHPEVDQDRARAHLTALLRRDDEEVELSPLARRILTTGHPSYKKAFAKVMSAAMRGQMGFANLTMEESRAVDAVRAMTVATGSQGGFAIPYVLDPTVIPTSNLSVNPFRAACRTEQITVNEWRAVTSAGITGTYGYTSEASEASDNSPVLVQPAMFMQRAQVFVPVSIELTQDWGSLQSELAQLIQDAKDDLEAAKFTSGTGTNEPQGILTGTTTSLVATASSGAFTLADLYNFEVQVPPRFRPRSFVMGNRFVYNQIRQFDTAGGAGLWVNNPGFAPLQTGLPNNVPRPGTLSISVLGYPSYEDSAMVASLTSGSKILLMGDPRYYAIVDRIGMDIEVIPHLFGSVSRFPTGQRGFYAFWRNNASVLSTNAFRVLKTSTISG
jgi:HK97 family phage major capsid protein